MKLSEIIDIEKLRTDRFGEYDLRDIDYQIQRKLQYHMDEIELADYLKIREIQLLDEMLDDVRELVNERL